MTKKDFFSDTHVLKALHGLKNALEAAAKERGTEVECLFIACGLTNSLGGTALHGCVCDKCVAAASAAIKRAADKCNRLGQQAVH